MRLRYYCIILLFTGFLIGCSSNSGSESDGSIEEKEYVLSRGSIMDHDSLKNNYKFIGEWKIGSSDGEIMIELYNSNNENVCYMVAKIFDTMEIGEIERDGNKYYLNVPIFASGEKVYLNQFLSDYFFTLNESCNFSKFYDGIKVQSIGESGDFTIGNEHFETEMIVTKIR